MALMDYFSARGLTRLIAGVCFLLIAGCTTLSINDDPTLHQAPDPLESLNRKIYSFNRVADKIILKPVSSAYDHALPKPAKLGVSNFFSNLREPLNALHNLLQGKGERALDSTYRFVVNSTMGLFGLIDVANRLGVDSAPEDLGQTLAAWGVGTGPYLMLPLLGPTNLRDGVGRSGDGLIYYPINEITDSTNGRFALNATDVVSTRAKLLGTDDILASQLDEYGFLKQAFENSRIDQLYDGNPPEKEEEDFDF